MPSTIFSLGPIIFAKFEIPQKLNFGGRQDISIHNFSDGRRIVDVIGPDDADIEFSGIFSGAEANQRALIIDSIRKSGRATSISWDIYYFPIVIREFSAIYENKFWIPYRIRCTVLSSATPQNIASIKSIHSIISNAVQQAALLGSIDGVDWVTFEQTLAQPNVSTAGTSEYSKAMSSVESIVTNIKQNINSTNNEFVNLDHGDTSSIESCVNLLASAVDLAFKSWKMVTAGGNVGQIYVTLASVGG